MMRSDFKLWDAMGSAVFLKNRAVIAPEARNQKGIIYTKTPNTQVKEWMLDIDFSIRRDKVNDQLRAGDGMGIYYLKYIDDDDSSLNNFYGYRDDFDGYGIFINTL